jgi:hypothetical protein
MLSMFVSSVGSLIGMVDELEKKVIKHLRFLPLQTFFYCWLSRVFIFLKLYSS